MECVILVNVMHERVDGVSHFDSVRLGEEMTAVIDVGFHLLQCGVICEHFCNVECEVVATPEQQTGRLVGTVELGDHRESVDVPTVVEKEPLVNVYVARPGEPLPIQM